MPNPLFPGMENFPRPPGDIHQALTMYQVGGIFFVIVINVIIIAMVYVIIIIIIIATGGAKPAPAECDEGARGEKCAYSKQVLYMMMTMMMEVLLVMVVMVLTPSRCCT